VWGGGGARTAYPSPNGIYGRANMGYVPCDMDGDSFVRCEDHVGSVGEGDPMLILDLPTDTLVVSDGPELPWTVRIALDPVPEDRE